MRIDLRTYAEALACPAPADVLLGIPVPPLTPMQIAEMARRLYHTVRMAGLALNAPIEVFCARGRRAALAVALLQQAGYTNVRNRGGVPCSR